jgi:hypothetical protein
VKPQRIAAKDDIARIETQPYAQFMAHGCVADALDAASTLHPERPALIFLESADPDAAHGTAVHPARRRRRAAHRAAAAAHAAGVFRAVGRRSRGCRVPHKFPAQD